MNKPVLALAALLLLPGMSLAALVTLDYNETSYTSSLTDTFDIGPDFGPIASAELSLYIAGRRTATNNIGYSWYYENDTTLIANVVNPWKHMSLPGSFELYTFPLTEDALTTLETTGTFNFTITGNDVMWYSDYGSSGYTSSRFYIDYAALNIESVPEPLSLATVVTGLGLVMARRRRIAG